MFFILLCPPTRIWTLEGPNKPGCHSRLSDISTKCPTNVTIRFYAQMLLERLEELCNHHALLVRLGRKSASRFFVQLFLPCTYSTTSWTTITNLNRLIQMAHHGSRAQISWLESWGSLSSRLCFSQTPTWWIVPGCFSWARSSNQGEGSASGW